MLSDEDKRLYGDRFIEGYTKCSLLGKYYWLFNAVNILDFLIFSRGGFAAVWLAVHDATKK